MSIRNRTFYSPLGPYVIASLILAWSIFFWLFFNFISHNNSEVQEVPPEVTLIPPIAIDRNGATIYQP